MFTNGGQQDGFDHLYLPQAYTTGDLDIHDLAVDAGGRLVFVNMLFGCLATLSETHSFKPLWRPPFSSRLAAEDRCHLNGLVMRDGHPAYVSAISQSDVVDAGATIMPRTASSSTWPPTRSCSAACRCRTRPAGIRDGCGC